MTPRQGLRALLDIFTLRPPAVAELFRDVRGLPTHDMGAERAIALSLGWLCRAQDVATSEDRGIARDFGLQTGWAPSYPETTGYIVPTFLRQAEIRDEPQLRSRAREMLVWLTEVQFDRGAIPGGVVGAQPHAPVIFNTGQVLLGFSAGVREFGKPFEKPARLAATWLADALDEDGAWRRFASPFRVPGPKTYYTHVAWALLEAARALDGLEGAVDAARRNLRWAVSHQRPNGWMEICDLTDSARPLTHTLGYALRGFVEGYRHLGEPELLDAAVRLADPLLAALRPDGQLSGRFDADWRPRASWSCLTGTSQVAICWILLYELTGEIRYLDAARRANRFVRRTVRESGSSDVAGGVKGSFPVWGEYGRYEFLTWAAKFAIDANQLQLDHAESDR